VTELIAVLAVVIAAAAAARSTWSPCGLSMLSTITPVTERAKGHSYRCTATWFVLGAVVGGASLGAVMAALAVGARSFHLSSGALGLLALGAATVAGVSDSGLAGLRVPIHRRQVNERWLDQYRSWVYGAGFGWQIGSGLMTYITTAAVYLMVALGALTTSPTLAFGIGCGFGLCRGLAVLLTMRITSPTALRAFHRRFTEAGPIVGRVATGTEVVTAAVLVVGVLEVLGVPASWPALVIVGAAVVLSALGRVLIPPFRRGSTAVGAEAGPVLGEPGFTGPVLTSGVPVGPRVADPAGPVPVGLLVVDSANNPVSSASA
jgi:hypothetical protein